ncbi:MAG: D-alanine--D-alanine ligase DdlA [Solirubrobacteraceae bacterium]
MRVAVLSGGRSSEHEVSLMSGAAVCEGLIAAGHHPLPVTITRGGSWLHDGRTLALTPGLGLLDADVVFPALHGPYGEDGVVQGLLEALGVPYVGAGVAASAVCIDKVLFKDLMGAAGLRQVGYVALRDGQSTEPVRALGLPLFVKPARLGSSVGIARVAAWDELEAALAAAFAHDGLVIVEAAASGIEVECSVLEGRGVSEPGEIVLAGRWYDYEAKYEAGGMELVIPARISEAARRRANELALEAFRRAGCSGLARADFFVDGDDVLLNELNTMPGFTPTSVYAKLWAASGLGYPDLLDELCRLALVRYARERSYRW